MRRAYLVVITFAAIVALWIVLDSTLESTSTSFGPTNSSPVVEARPETSRDVEAQLREPASHGDLDPLDSRSVRGTIHGRVVDDRAMPLDDVIVAIVDPHSGSDSSESTPSDERGEFALSAKHPGSCVIRASKRGFATQTVRATTTESSMIVMQPASRIEFLVVDDSGRPVSDARISIRTDELDDARFLGSTDSSGRLDCEVPTRAAVLVVDCSDGRGVRESGFLLAPGSQGERLIRLPAEPAIRLAVIDENRNPLASVRFEFPGPDGWTPLESRTLASEGQILHEFFAPVGRFVRISAPTRASRIAHLDPIERTEAFTEIQLEPEAIVRLSARVDGKPSTVTVEVSRPPLLDISDRFLTDPSGYIELRGIPLDVAVQLELADSTRNAMHMTTVRIPRDLQPRILDLGEIELSESTSGRVLRCSVRDERDEPLSGAWAHWLVSRVGPSGTESDEIGEIRTSDESGALEIPIPHRARRLAIGKSGYAQQVFSVSRDEGEIPLVLRLEKEILTRGVVVDEVGQPVPAAIVESYRGREPEVLSSVITDTEGKFELPGQPSTAVSLRARKAGFVPSNLLEPSSLSGPNRIELTRLGALEIELKRFDEALQPTPAFPSSWSIALTSDGVSTTQDTLPSSSTSWAAQLPVGRYTIRIDSPTNGTALVSAVVTPHATTHIVATTTPLITRTLRFVDTNGLPLLVKSVTVRSADPERSNLELVDATLSGDEPLSIALPRGSFVVKFRTAEGAGEERTAIVELREDSPEPLRLVASELDR